MRLINIQQSTQLITVHLYFPRGKCTMKFSLAPHPFQALQLLLERGGAPRSCTMANLLYIACSHARAPVRSQSRTTSMATSARCAQTITGMARAERCRQSLYMYVLIYVYAAASQKQRDVGPASVCLRHVRPAAHHNYLHLHLHPSPHPGHAGRWASVDARAHACLGRSVPQCMSAGGMGPRG